MKKKQLAKRKKPRPRAAKPPAGDAAPDNNVSQQSSDSREKEEEEEEKRILSSLIEAFRYVSLEQASAAYKQAGGDPNKAAEVLQNLVDEDNVSEDLSGDPYTSSMSSASSSSGPGFSELCVQTMPAQRSGKRSKQRRRVVASTGMVSAMIGKDYVNRIRKQEPTCEFNDDMRMDMDMEEAEQFLCSILGDNSELGFTVVRDVLCQCRYDVEKALDALLELSDSASKNSRNPDGREDMGRQIEFAENFADKDSDCTSHLSDLEVQDGFWSTSNGPSPSSILSDLPQKVLESLFNISKSSEHEPSTMNWRNVVKKMQSLGPMVDVSPSGVEERQQDSYAKGDEYQVFRKASKEHWDSMRTSYKKATAAYSKGERAYASYLSDQGKVQTKLARAADERASFDIFKARNKDLENVITIDLHGQHVKQAMRLFKLHLLFGAYVPSVHGLRVITGSGMHGVGKSKLKQAVVQLLEKEEIKWSLENQGTVLVKIDWHREFNFLDSESDEE